MKYQVSRRNFLNRLVGTICGGLLFNTACSRRSKLFSKSELYIYSWADYLDPSTIPEFQKRYGVRVIYDTFASNEALLAKLQAGGCEYDLIVPTNYMVQHLIKLNLLAEIDHSSLVGLRNLADRFLHSVYDPGLQHSLPYTWGTAGIAFNQDLVSQKLGKNFTIDSFDIFWDKRLANRMTLLDDGRETIGMSLKRRGNSYNCLDTNKIENAVQDLKIQKPLTMCYTSDQVILQLTSKDSLASLAYSGDAYQAARENPEIKYVIPKTGTSIWTDSLCMLRDAPHVDNAYKWLNYMLEPDVSAAIANYTRYASPNRLAWPKIDPVLSVDKNLYPPESVLDLCEEIGDVGPMISFYDRMWTELKCS